MRSKRSLVISMRVSEEEWNVIHEAARLQLRSIRGFLCDAAYRCLRGVEGLPSLDEVRQNAFARLQSPPARDIL